MPAPTSCCAPPCSCRSAAATSGWTTTEAFTTCFNAANLKNRTFPVRSGSASLSKIRFKNETQAGFGSIRSVWKVLNLLVQSDAFILKNRLPRADPGSWRFRVSPPRPGASSASPQPHHSHLCLVGSSVYLSAGDPAFAGPVLGPGPPARTWVQAPHMFSWLLVCAQDLLSCAVTCSKLTHLRLPHLLSSGWWRECFLVLPPNPRTLKLR